MKLLIANCRGMGGVIGAGGGVDTDLKATLRREKADMYLLTETKIKQIDFNKVRQWWGQYKNVRTIFIDGNEHPGHRKRGTMILIKNGLNFKINAVKTSGKGRYIMINILLNARLYNVVCMYGFSGGDDGVSMSNLKLMYEDLKVFRQLNQGITIIGGDFNFVTQH